MIKFQNFFILGQNNQPSSLNRKIEILSPIQNYLLKTKKYATPNISFWEYRLKTQPRKATLYTDEQIQHLKDTIYSNAKKRE
jgi:hypothetical protein